MFSLSFHYLQKMSRAFSMITRFREVAIWLSRQDSLRTSLPASDQNVVDCKRLNNELHFCVAYKGDVTKAENELYRSHIFASKYCFIKRNRHFDTHSFFLDITKQ